MPEITKLLTHHLYIKKAGKAGNNKKKTYNFPSTYASIVEIVTS
jgi:hypothetical protein